MAVMLVSRTWVTPMMTKSVNRGVRRGTTAQPSALLMRATSRAPPV